ncbi:MAG: YHS domain-containing (seleno)protein [Cyclobacteriaceae bacterium]
MSKTLLMILMLIAASHIASSQHRYVQTRGEAAFDGFDLVSYFTSAKPVKGNPSYKYEYDGLTLLFASKENLEIFKKKPYDYLPAYGGYCATAVSSDRYVIPNFESYAIQNEKLLFFEVQGFFNGKTQWEKDPQLFEILADKHYREEFVEKDPKN